MKRFVLLVLFFTTGVALAASPESGETTPLGTGYGFMFHDIYRDDLNESRNFYRSQPNDAPPSSFPYDRGAFEEAAENLHIQLLESNSHSYGGIFVSPLREHATVGFIDGVDPATVIPSDLPFEVEVLEVRSTYRQREEAATELRRHELYSLSYGSLEDKMRLSIDPAEYDAVRETLLDALSVVASSAQAEEAIAELDAAPFSGTHAAAGPVFVVLEKLEIRTLPSPLASR